MVNDATAHEATETTEPAADPEAAKVAAEALAWLDATLGELGGALEACGKCIDAGTLDATIVSSRMNALVMQMMGTAAG